MNLYFDELLGDGYKSKSQKVRVMSENWARENLFCPCCGNPHIKKLKNNSPVADMKCERCGEIFELKSKKGKVGGKVNGSAYYAMIERITSLTNPDMFLLQYSPEYKVTDLTLIPKFFLVPQIVEKRKPLAATAKRAGWTGCNILYSEIPQQGKIIIIENGTVRPVKEVVKDYNRIKKLETQNIEARSWMLDVLQCVNNIESNEFSLSEIYSYVAVLQKKHPDNHNVEAKIRQQLQFLRNEGFIEFLNRGHYRKI